MYLRCLAMAVAFVRLSRSLLAAVVASVVGWFGCVRLLRGVARLLRLFCDGCGCVSRPLLTGWVIDPFPSESL